MRVNLSSFFPQPIHNSTPHTLFESIWIEKNYDSLCYTILAVNILLDSEESVGASRKIGVNDDPADMIGDDFGSDNTDGATDGIVTESANILVGTSVGVTYHN